MTPKVKIFENVFRDSSTGHRSTFRDQIWWKSAVAKYPKGRVVYQKKTRAPRETRTSSHFGQNWPIALKIPERRHPLICPCIPNLVRIGCVLPDFFRKDWFFGPKSQHNRAYRISAYNKHCCIRHITRTIQTCEAKLYANPLNSEFLWSDAALRKVISVFNKFMANMATHRSTSALLYIFILCSSVRIANVVEKLPTACFQQWPKL